MKLSRLEMPAGQNWSCHSCGDCCRGRLSITVTAEEKQRIEQQGWTAADGVEPAKMIVAGLTHHRLGHQADGACVFLDAQNRCRIHAKFGEAAKPLACRLYPLLIHPAGKKVRIGLRFSCPSAAANLGKSLAGQGTEIAKLAKSVLPDDHEEIPAPPVAATPGLDWPDFLRFTNWLDRTLAEENVPVALKLLRGLHWLEMVERGCLDQISGDGADEILEALVQSAVEKLAVMPKDLEPPTGFGKLFLRLMVLEHARTATVADREIRSGQRWQMLVAALKFIRSSGRTPELRAELKRVPFAEIEKSFGALSPGAEALLTRYFRVKIQSLQFCGTAFHDCSLIEGFRNLALLFPIIVWLARWLAVSDGHSALTDADMVKAVSLVDYQYSFAPYLGWRTRLLHQRNDIARLCGWYAR